MKLSILIVSSSNIFVISKLYDSKWTDNLSYKIIVYMNKFIFFFIDKENEEEMILRSDLICLETVHC